MSNGKYVSKVILFTPHEWSLIINVASLHDRMTEFDVIHKALRCGLEHEIDCFVKHQQFYEQLDLLNGLAD